MRQSRPALYQILDILVEEKNVTVLKTGVLWLVSVFLATMCIFALRELFLWGLAAILARNPLDHEYQSSGIVNVSHYCAVIVLGIVGMAVIIAISEYVFRRTGKPGTLRTLTGIIVVESAIVLPVALLFWR